MTISVVNYSKNKTKGIPTIKKHTCRAKNVNKINWKRVTVNAADDALLFAIDVAKEKQYALLSSVSGTVSELIWWKHPEQATEMLGILESFSSPLDVVMESTGTYGDAMCYQFKHSGFGLYQISAKRVSGAQEFFDGIGSLSL